AQNLLFELRPHARECPKFLFPAELFQLVHTPNLEMLEEQRDSLGAESLDLEEFERGGRVLEKQGIPALARTAIEDLADHRRQTLADAGDVRHLAGRIAHYVRHALGMAFDRSRSVPVTTDAEGILACDFHQVGGLVERARDVF